MRGHCFLGLILFVFAGSGLLDASQSARSESQSARSESQNAQSESQNAQSESYIYAVVMNGRHSGVMEMTITPGKNAGAPTVTDQETLVKVEMLGTATDITVRSKRLTAPDTGKILSIDTHIARGDKSQGARLLFKEGEVVITPKGEGETKTLKIDSAVVVDDGISFPYLIRDLSDAGEKSKKYAVLDTMRGEVIDRLFTRSGPAKVKLANRVFDCLVFESVDTTVGVRGKVWVDRATGRAVRTENSMGMITYLTDAVYKKKFLEGEPPDDVAKVDRPAANAQLQTIGEIPWKEGEVYEYVYTYGDKETSRETFLLKGVEKTEKGQVFSCANEFKIQKMTLAFEWKLDQAARPVSYSAETRASGTRYEVDCAFSDTEVAVDAHRLGYPMKKTIPFSEKSVPAHRQGQRDDYVERRRRGLPADRPRHRRVE